MLLDRLRIRGRLLALVAVPLVLIIGLAVAVAVDRATRAARASQIAATARQAGDVARLLQELQEERLLALGYLAGRVEPTDLTGQSAVVRDLARVASDVVPADRPGLAATVRGVVSLDGLRARVLERSATPLETYSGYTQAIVGVIGSLRLTDAVDTASPGGRQLAALSAFIEANEANSESAALLVILADEIDDLTIQRYAASRAVAAEAAQRFRGYATPAEIGYLDGIGQAYEARVGTGFATSFAANPRRAVEQLDLDALFPQLDSFDVLGRFTERTILTEVNAEVEAEARRELVAAGSVAAFALLLPLIVVGFGLTVGAGIARPLRRLTRSADRIARAAEAELERVADDEAEAARADPPRPGRRRGPRRDRRPGPRLRPGADHRGPAGRAPGRRPAQRRPDVRARRPPYAEPGRPPARPDRQPGAPRRPTATACASCTASTTCPAGCAGTRAAWSCSPVAPARTSTWPRCRSPTSSGWPSVRSRTTPGSTSTCPRRSSSCRP